MSNSISPVVQEISKQIRTQLHHSLWHGTYKRSKFHNPKSFTYIQMDENTLRCAKGKTNIDISYDNFLDLYNVTVHKIKKNFDVESKTTEGVYFDSLLTFF